MERRPSQVQHPYVDPKSLIQVPFQSRWEGSEPIYEDYNFKENPKMRKRFNNIFSGRDFGWNRRDLLRSVTDMRRMAPGVTMGGGGSKIEGGYDPREKSVGIINTIYDRRLKQALPFNEKLKKDFASRMYKLGITDPKVIDQHRAQENMRLKRRNAGYQIPGKDSLYPDNFDPVTGKEAWSKRANDFVYGEGRHPAPPDPDNPDLGREVPWIIPAPPPEPAAPPADAGAQINSNPRHFPFYG